MFAVLGLGNPGPRYEGTRHNIGFMAVDAMAASHGVKVSEKGGPYTAGRISVGGAEVVIAKPLTYMNLSGTAARALLSAIGASAKDLIVVYDDADLDFGKLRIRKDGGSGGHRGMESIINVLGTKDFPRVRLGIGKPKSGPMSDYVLEPFSKEDGDTLDGLIERAAKAVEVIITNGVEYAMNGYNR